MNDKMDYDLYVLAEISYKKAFNLESEENLFPEGWYSSNNYKLKTEILAEAIDNNTLIEETPMYKEAVINKNL